MTDPIYAEDIVAGHFPLHGPYSPERAELATDVVAELVRYLNYATGQGAHAALPHAPALYRVLGALTAAAGGLDQTLRQLTTRARQLSADPTLRHCEQRDTPQTAVTAAGNAATHLAAARQAGEALRAELAAAQSHLAWLYHQHDEPQGSER